MGGYVQGMPGMPLEGRSTGPGYSMSLLGGASGTAGASGLATSFKTVQEAIDAYMAQLQRGGNLPLSQFLASVDPSGGGGLGAPGGGPSTRVSTGSSSGTGTTTLSGSGTTSGNSSTTLPDDVRQRYLDYLDNLAKGTGPGAEQAKAALQRLLDSPGYTPEEQAQMTLDRQEGQDIIHLAGEPIAGAAENARQKLMMLNAARGGGTSGYNATIERIGEQQGRDASTASLQAKLGIEAANRSAATLIGQGRMGQEQAGADLAGRRELGVGGLQGAAIGNFPERNTKASGTTTTNESGTTNTNTNTNDKTTTGPSTPGGTILSGSGGGMAPGQTGAVGKAPAAAPTAAPPPTLLGGLVPPPPIAKKKLGYAAPSGSSYIGS